MTRKDILTCLLIVIVGAFLRIYHYDNYPPSDCPADEYAFTWSGMSLLKTGTPTSCSWLTAYTNPTMQTWRGESYRMVTPWLDHPLLMGVIYGSFDLLGGETEYSETSLRVMRIPSLFFGILSIALLYLLARFTFGTGTAVIAASLYATSPEVVIPSRLAVAENLITLLLLIVLLCFERFKSTGKRGYFWGAVLCAGLAPLAKVTGVFVAIMLFTLLLFERKRKDALIALLIGTLLASLYPIYGSLRDFGLFWEVIAGHLSRYGDRPQPFSHILFTSPIRDVLHSAILTVGWIAICLLYSRMTVFICGVLSYLLILVALGTNGHWYYWYTIPFYLFLIIALGELFRNFLKKPTVALALVFAVFLCLPIGNEVLAVASKWLNLAPEKSWYNILGFHLALVLLVGPFCAQALWPCRTTKRLGLIVSILFFLCLLGANIFLVLGYTTTRSSLPMRAC